MKRSETLAGEIINWIVAVVGIVLLVRLLFMLVQLVFNFPDTALGQRLGEGQGLIPNFSSAGAVRNLIVQVVIVAALVTLYKVSRKSKSAPSDNDEQR